MGTEENAEGQHGVEGEGGGDYQPYQHNDGFDSYRWNAKECFRNLEDRPWGDVLKFYSLVAAGSLSLSDLTFAEVSKHAGCQTPKHAKNWTQLVPLQFKDSQKELKGGKWERKTYKIVLSYDGNAFIGWQKQPGFLTVQGVLEEALGSLLDEKRAVSLDTKYPASEAVLSVAGRTDKGVHAVGQVCSFYTWRRDIRPEQIESLVNTLEPQTLRAVSVEEVPRSFHPNFSAKWRRYVYILPLHDADVEGALVENALSTDVWRNNGDNGKSCTIQRKPSSFPVVAVNSLLSKLQGQQLSYAVFARDTKASRSRGPPTECIIYHARATSAELPLIANVSKTRRKVMCVELVANRFLRKMVRVLVATSIREAAAGAPCDSLLRMTTTTCRRASAPPAPAFGLCLAEACYDDFPATNLLMS